MVIFEVNLPNNMLKKILDESFQIPESRSLHNLLVEKLKLSGLSKTQFERLAGLQRRSLDGILKKTSKQTDAINLLKLGEFLDLSMQELFVLHFSNRPINEIKELQTSMELTYINKFFDLKTLSSLGFIDNDSTLEELKERICSFFGVDSIYDYENELNEALYSRTKRSFSNKMKDFWIKSSNKYFELINNPNDYNRDSLIELIPKIKPYTQNVENGLLTVFQALFNIGVTVVFQPKLPKTQIRGATFLIKEKPCIVITDLNRNYATVWFALIHELHHVLFDLEILKKTKYHLTGEPDLFLLQEDKANEFASEYLISNEKMIYIENLINNPLIVERFAKECQIHPSIIYAQYQWRESKKGNEYWGSYKKYFPKIELAIQKLNVSNWDVESLKIAAEKVKELLTV